MLTYPIWDEAVGKVPWDEIDPMVEDFPVIGRDTRMAILGCCFFQRMAPFFRAAGHAVYMTEAPSGDKAFASARFGTVVSARQSLQLFQRAYGEIDVPDSVGIWTRKADGLLIDALRPGFADAFATAREVKQDRAAHLAAVREMFENAEVILYSIGQTECWLSRSSGLFYPVQPGAMNRDFNADDIAFKNFTVTEVVADFTEFLSRLRGVNPVVKVILAVSPLPIIATFERGRHVLTANSRSKSVLRAAVDEICSTHGNTHYFPAYEMIAGPQAGGKLHEQNMRLVTDAGLSMAMRLLMRHFSTGEA